MQLLRVAEAIQPNPAATATIQEKEMSHMPLTQPHHTIS